MLRQIGAPNAFWRTFSAHLKRYGKLLGKAQQILDLGIACGNAYKVVETFWKVPK
jgi:hypothetical protein